MLEAFGDFWVGDAELAQQRESPPVFLFDGWGISRLQFPKCRTEPRGVLAALRFLSEHSAPAEWQECFGDVTLS